MKIAILSFFTFLILGLPDGVLAQKPVKKVISVPNARTEVCKNRIENYFLREYGVVSTRVNFKKHTVTVLFIPTRTNINNIRTALANLGFDADDVKANPESYKRLPPDCQNPPEGQKEEKK